MWKPDMASLGMEELMEEKDLPEEDRDQVRRFAEFLRRRKDKKDGKELMPAPEGMREWILGENKEEKAMPPVGLPPDPETPVRCDHCVWTGKIVHTLAEDNTLLCCPDCGEPVTILEE